MTDNLSGQLPPEARLTDDQRARMRAGLMAGTREPVRRPRPWLVPAAAAAAVAVVAAGVTVVGVSLSDGEEGGDAGSAGQDTSSAADPTEPVPAETSPAPPEPTYGPVGQQACDRAVPDYLPGATKAAEYAYGDVGTTFLYSAGQQWVVCDTWATEDGGVPTITGVHAYGSPLDEQLLLISQNYSMNDGVGAQFFAAGAPIPGVRSIQYSFPDGTPADGGHLVDAVFTDGMWVMQYLMSDAPARAWTEPVKVAAVFDDGSREEVFLTELELCAQVNHGC
jgi:hypothetical protein